MLNYFYGEFFRTQYWYLQYALGINSNWFFKQDLCNSEKIHTFFLLLRSSILKLDYLCDCGSSISEIWHWGILLNYLSNATSLTWFGFPKENLCPISHNDLIMDWFNRSNLYDLPNVTVFSLSSEIDSKETKVCVFVSTL